MFLAINRQLCGERQSVPAGQDIGRPGGHGEYPQPRQCALCGQRWPAAAAEGRGHAASGALQPRTGVQPQPHAAGPRAARHRRPHHGGQRYMTLVARPRAPFLQNWAHALDGLYWALALGQIGSMSPCRRPPQVGVMDSPLSMKRSHHWRHYRLEHMSQWHLLIKI